MIVREIIHNGRRALLRVELNDYALMPVNRERFTVPGLGLMTVVNKDSQTLWLPKWQPLLPTDAVEELEALVHPSMALISDEECWRDF